MKLYQIADVYQIALQNLVDPETGEINEQALARLSEISTDLEEEAKNVAAFIGNLEAEAAAIREAELNMTERRRTLEKQATKAREYLLSNMERTGINEITCPYFAIKLKRCPPSVDVMNISKLPVQYFRQVIEVDRIAIAKALKVGAEVPGARLVTDKLRLEIR